MAAPAVIEQVRTTTVSPLPQQNEVDALGQRARAEMARRMVEAHSAGLRSRRQRDLTCEKFLLHIDGGELQWADIYNGSKITIPRGVSEFRKTENLLRPIVDNAVAHHTTMPLRYFADSSPDRKARDKALIDAIWINYLAEQQDFNELFAQALYLAMATGFCPVHAYWRDDRIDQHEPVAYGQTSQDPLQAMFAPQPGMIDCFVGNPFDTVFDRTSRRGSVHWSSYGRLVPANLVRAAFDHIPEARSLEGSTKIPSVAIYQRIARDWRMGELEVHGTAILDDLRRGYVEGGDEMLQLVCREVLPRYEADWPNGRLQIVAVPGDTDPRRGQDNSSRAVMLADQELPAGDFSWSLFYSHQRADDVLGKPWVEDLDGLQVDLNLGVSKEWEQSNKMMEAPIVVPGGALAEDMADIGGYNILEIEPSMAGARPRVMEWPEAVLVAIRKIIEDKRRTMYTIGGYQAASRGESPGSRTPYRALLALQQADSTVHGPVNARFRRSGCDFARKCWKQMKTYGDVPWLVDIVGDEYEHLAEQYIDGAALSDQPPKYKLVNAFGATPEIQRQELLELMQLRGADGDVFLSTEEARRQWPDQRAFGSGTNPKAVARRRARVVASKFHLLAKQVREQGMIESLDITDPQVQQAAMVVFFTIESRYPRLRDDDLQAHLDALSEIIQDESADPIARQAAQRRQALYYDWQMAMAMQGQPVAIAPAGNGKPQRRTNQVDRQAVARDRIGQPGTTLSDVEAQPRRSATAGRSPTPAPPSEGTARRVS